MAKGWKCPHCSTENPSTTLTCSGCGRLQGSVVVPGSSPVAPALPTPATGSAAPEPSHGWQSGASGWSTGAANEAPGPTPAEMAVDPPVEAPPTSPWAVNLATVPPASTPLLRRLPIGWLIVGLLVVGGGVAGYLFNASRSSTGEIDRSGDLTANDLRVGDCFDLKDPDAEQIGDVTGRPCSEAHEYEVFYVGNLADGEYPPEAVMETFVVDNCGPAFDSYVGMAFAESELGFYWLSPSPESWRDGDRAIQCAAYDPRDARLTISLKGIAQ
jgi:hypothetical protein